MKRSFSDRYLDLFPETAFWQNRGLRFWNDRRGGKPSVIAAKL